VGKFIGILFVALFWNGIVSVFVFQALKAWLKGGGFMERWFLPIFLIPFVLIGLALIGAVVHALLGLFNPRPVLKISSRAIPLGGSFGLDWTVSRGLGRLERLIIELEGREQATYQSGKHTRTDKHVFHTVPIVDSTQRQEIQQGHALVQIPAAAMHSFRAPHNAIVWVLRLRGTIRLWPDVEAEYELEVLPAG
jgi:hypothetical protein